MSDKGKEGFLPQRTCPVCEETFTWQKKWSDCWHRVTYCSESCRQRDEKPAENQGQSKRAGRDETLRAAE